MSTTDMMSTLIRPAKRLALGVAFGFAVATTGALAAGGGGEDQILRQQWSFGGFFGKYDRAQLQRGYQVYTEVCATCHGLKRIAFRNLGEKGGPEFPEETLKKYVASFKVMDGPNDQGKMFERPAKLSDRIPPPYKNEQEARSIHNGAYPPDQSLIIKARGVETEAPWYTHWFLMLRDVAVGYQEGGSDYAYALLTGYKEEPPSYTRDAKGRLTRVAEGKKPEGKAEVCASVTLGEDGKPDTCNKLQDGLHYNKYFPGHQIAMANPLIGGAGLVSYAKGPDGKPTAPETAEQYARDVTAFLSWASDPSLEQRKRTGWQVMLYLFLTSILLYIAKKRIWAKAH
jgi:ubiquinol-cytochrome c reductase cytochrome c1 subunit